MKTTLIILILALAGYYAYDKYGHEWNLTAKPAKVEQEEEKKVTVKDALTAIPDATSVAPANTPATADAPPAEQPKAASSEPAGPTYLYLTERVSKVTETGITGISKGTRVEAISKSNGMVMITDGRTTIEVLEAQLSVTSPEPPPSASPSPAVAGQNGTRTALDSAQAAAIKRSSDNKDRLEKLRIAEQESTQRGIARDEHNRRIYNRVSAIDAQITALQDKMAGMSQQSRARFRPEMEELQTARAQLLGTLQ